MNSIEFGAVLGLFASFHGTRGIGDAGWQQLPPTDGLGVIEAAVRFADDDVALGDRFMEQAPVEVRLAAGGPETARWSCGRWGVRPWA